MSRKWPLSFLDDPTRIPRSDVCRESLLPRFPAAGDLSMPRRRGAGVAVCDSCRTPGGRVRDPSRAPHRIRGEAHRKVAAVASEPKRTAGPCSPSSHPVSDNRCPHTCAGAFAQPRDVYLNGRRPWSATACDPTNRRCDRSGPDLPGPLAGRSARRRRDRSRGVTCGRSGQGHFRSSPRSTVRRRSPRSRSSPG